MPTIRRMACAAVLAAVMTGPALADTCRLTIGGKLVLDDETCSASTRGGVLMATAEGGLVLQVRRSTLLVASPDVARVRRRYRGTRFKSYGLIVTSDGVDGRVCYASNRAVLCIARETGLGF